ncbi:MAG: hypothetical protein IJQ73_13885 [Kiritimatiellae bacterium]|nr:hypothetical protein [Kiritimatiellia bacterium]
MTRARSDWRRKKWIVRPDATVTVKLDIEASSPTPFDANLVRAVRENASPANLDIAISEFTE